MLPLQLSASYGAPREEVDLLPLINAKVEHVFEDEDACHQNLSQVEE